METSAPLLYAAYPQPHDIGPMLKIELLPIRKLVKLVTVREKAKLPIQRYVSAYGGLFVAVVALAAIGLAAIYAL